MRAAKKDPACVSNSGHQLKRTGYIMRSNLHGVSSHKIASSSCYEKIHTTIVKLFIAFFLLSCYNGAAHFCRSFQSDLLPRKQYARPFVFQLSRNGGQTHGFLSKTS